MNAVELRNFRISLGLTQALLARKIGKSLRKISSYERGEAAVPKTVALACEALAERNRGNES